ncbi:MAG: flippase-like domain-containing protein [Bdellovibrionales bacterium]|jgi:putative membrane protein
MIRLASFLGLIGLVIATCVIAWSGYDQVLQALQQAGWGIVWTSLFHIVPMMACVLGWQALLPGRIKAGKLFFLYVLWIRASINNLMPVARIGGEIVSVRVMMKHGMRKSPAIASTVVEITTSVIAQFVFVLLGVWLFLMRVADQSVTAQLLWGLVITAPVIGALLYVQKIGFFGLFEKLFRALFRDKWARFAGSAARLDHAVRTMYRRRGKAFYCFVMQLISWALCSVEIWLALHYLGHPLSLLESMMIEALIQATSSAAFVVPGALGVQEAGFLLFGSMLGLTPEIAAALAVIRRCRDLLLYVPGLIVWQVQEGRWLLEKKN